MSVDDSVTWFLVKGFMKVVLATLVFILVIIASGIYGDYMYKRGQVDYANGVIKYELIETNTVKQKWVAIE